MGDGDDLDLAAAKPAVGGLEHAVARSRAAAALFGVTAAVTIGRYQVLSRAGAGGGGEVWVAWDPELDRRVALKVIATATSAAQRARVRAEGQALARLSHPHVVPVHDVLDHGEQVVLVMEYVDGRSLRAWVGGGRPWREVVRAYRQVGLGLAAMHAAGLVHRDVKPDNAVVDGEGWVRVIDLGLAVAAGAGVAEGGRVAGTPRYMAPEQAAGQAVTAAADQYALCVSLREALTAGGGAVPAWLGPVLARGAAAEPAARFPSMATLVAALARDPARRRRRLAVGASALGAVGVAFALGRAGGDEPAAGPRCDGGAAAIAAVWDGGRRAAVEARFTGAGTPYAAAAAPALVARLDEYAGAWAARADLACRAREAGEVSPTLAERRAGCLASARAALDAVVDVAVAASPDDLAHVREAVATLPAVDRCADDAALLADVPPPPPAKAEAAAALDERLARARVHVDAARPDALALTGALVADADALGHPPLLARALVLDGRARRATADQGAERFARATGVALAAGDDPLAVEAFARDWWAAGTSAGQAPAPEGLDLVVALAERLPPGSFAAALLANNRGAVALARGDRAAAREAFTEGLARAATVTGPDATELLVLYNGLALVTDDDRERARLGDALVLARAAALGQEHPLTLEARITRGMLAADPADAAAVLAGACADLDRFHPRGGGTLAECWFELGVLADAADRRDEARAAFARVVATEATGGDRDRVAVARAQLARLDGRADLALAGFTAALAAMVPPDLWWIGVQRAEARLGLARTLAERGRVREARAEAARAADELAPIDQRMRLPWIARRLAWARALAA